MKRPLLSSAAFNNNNNDDDDAGPSAAAAVVVAPNKNDDMNQQDVYVPPAKRRQLELVRQQQQQQQQQQQRQEEEQQQQQEQPMSSSSSSSLAALGTGIIPIQQQKQTWDQQKRIIFGTINRLNSSNIKELIYDLLVQVNIIRLRGVLCKSILLATSTSHIYTYIPIYAAFIAVLHSKLPEIGELIVIRSILNLRKYYTRRDKHMTLTLSILLGHLFHQGIVHELVILQLLTLFLDGYPTDDSVDLAVQLLDTTGQALLEVSPMGVRAVLERLRALLHEGILHQKVQYNVEQLLQRRQHNFIRSASIIPTTPTNGTTSTSGVDATTTLASSSSSIIPPELDLIERDDQITLEISLDDDNLNRQEELDTFHIDPKYEENEIIWKQIRNEILGIDNEEEDDNGEEDDQDDNNSDEEEEHDPNPTDQALVMANSNSNNKGTMVVVQDLSEADLVHLRRQIYLTIMSSATFEECVHKLAKIHIPDQREEELINMLIECCSQERTFLRFYGLVAERFCLLADRWKNGFMDAFTQQYSTIHRLETNKLRNVAKLFAHILHTDSIPWSVLSIIHLNEEETTSSSRIFIKIIIQEMTEAMGMERLKNRFYTNLVEQAVWYQGLFPRDNLRNTRYAINFFTAIGLGPLTDGLRDYLKNAPKLIMAQVNQIAQQQQPPITTGALATGTSSSSTALIKSKGDKNKNRKGHDDDNDSLGSSRSSSSFSSSSSSYSSTSSSSYTSSSGSSRSYSSSSSSSSSSSYSQRDRSDKRERGRSQRSNRGNNRRRRSYSSASSSSDSNTTSSSYSKSTAASSRSSSISQRRSGDDERRRHQQPPRKYDARDSNDKKGYQSKGS